MAQVICITGNICCGKTTYAAGLCRQRGAVLLSVDEIMLALFGQHCGSMHDTYTERTKAYLYAKALELIQAGVDVVLDWGFWQRKDREQTRRFFAERQIPCVFHGIDIPDAVWRQRVAARNQAAASRQASAYFVDEALAAKCAGLFEPPGPEEIDLWIRN